MRELIATLKLLAIAAFFALLGGMCAKAFGQEGHEHDYGACEWAQAGSTEKCMCQCRRRHCDAWIACSGLSDPDRASCQKQVEKDWERCQGGCSIG